MINAYQAMPKGGKIFLRTSYDNDIIKIELEDTGIGIEPIHIPKIFNIFYTTKADNKGTGLGLAICKRIVEEDGGQICVDSVIEKGTKYTITIPVNPVRKSKIF